MPQLPKAEIDAIVVRLDAATTTYEQGKAFEDLFCAIFRSIPGIVIAARNVMNTFRTEEVDVALWNNKHKRGFDFLPEIILIECKNWSSAVGSAEVVYFKERLAHRSCEYGILFAANGISGNPAELTQAHYEIAMALASHIRIIVIKRDELLAINDSDGLVILIKEKLLELTLILTNH